MTCHVHVRVLIMQFELFARRDDRRDRRDRYDERRRSRDRDRSKDREVPAVVSYPIGVAAGDSLNEKRRESETIVA